MNMDEFFTLSPVEQAATARALGYRAHRGPDDWQRDIAKSNKRALAVIASIHHGTPRPVFGTHRGAVTDA